MRRGAIAGLSLAVGGVLAGSALSTHRAQAAAETQGGAAHYTVVETQGFNLLVTDNNTNRLYYYTIDKDQNVGATLKLRASVDLNQVGEPTIKPTTPQANSNM